MWFAEERTWTARVTCPAPAELYPGEKGPCWIFDCLHKNLAVLQKNLAVLPISRTQASHHHVLSAQQGLKWDVADIKYIKIDDINMQGAKTELPNQPCASKIEFPANQCPSQIASIGGKTRADVFKSLHESAKFATGELL